jgi:hypothetical protein
MSKDNFAADYIPVNERISAFIAKYPEGSLRPLWPDEPYRVLGEGETKWLVYGACAYRTPDDQAPGVGLAWEPVPGRTPYTRGSELMVAETSAWGRALAAIGIATNKSIASAEEVRSAQERSGASQTAGSTRTGVNTTGKANAPQNASQDVEKDRAWG